MNDELIRGQFEYWAAPQGLRLHRRDSPGSTRLGQYCADDTQLAFEAFRAALSHAAGQECTLGVGDGSGQLFVHGSYEAIKACQALILRGEAAGHQADKPLTADMAKALPGGIIDDTTFDQIEHALDRAGAPACDEPGKWLTLCQRIAALAPANPPINPAEIDRKLVVGEAVVVPTCEVCGAQFLELHECKAQPPASAEVVSCTCHEPRQKELCLNKHRCVLAYPLASSSGRKGDEMP